MLPAVLHNAGPAAVNNAEFSRLRAQGNGCMIVIPCERMIDCSNRSEENPVGDLGQPCHLWSMAPTRGGPSFANPGISRGFRL